MITSKAFPIGKITKQMQLDLIHLQVLHIIEIIKCGSQKLHSKCNQTMHISLAFPIVFSWPDSEAFYAKVNTENIHFCCKNMRPQRLFAKCIPHVVRVVVWVAHTLRALGWNPVGEPDEREGKGYCLYAWQHLQPGNIEISNRRHSYKRVNGRVSGTHTHSHSYEYTQIIIKNIILRHLRGNVCRNFNEFAPTTTTTTTVAATMWHTRNADGRTGRRTEGWTDTRVRALPALGKLAIKTHFVENAIF